MSRLLTISDPGRTVLDGERNAVWRQAVNRMHTARGAMAWMLEVRT